MSEAEDEASQGIASVSETTLTCGRYRGDNGNGGSIRGALITRGSDSTPPYRNACVRESGGGWRSCASNEGRTRGTCGTYTAVDERGMRRRPWSPDNCRGVRV